MKKTYGYCWITALAAAIRLKELPTALIKPGLPLQKNSGV